ERARALKLILSVDEPADRRARETAGMIALRHRRGACGKFQCTESARASSARPISHSPGGAETDGEGAVAKRKVHGCDRRSASIVRRAAVGRDSFSVTSGRV